MTTRLCPAQQEAYDGLRHALKYGSVLVLYGDAGMGKSTVLRELHGETGGTYLTMKDFIDAIRHETPLAMEETFELMVMTALARHDAVIVDDLHLITNVIGACGDSYYPRSGFIDAPLTTIATYASESGKRIVFGCDGRAPEPISRRCYYFGVREFKPRDYHALCEAYLPTELAARLDYDQIFRFAPKLNGHQLRGSCEYLRLDADLDTTRFVEYLRSRRMASNVDLIEVQPVALSDLKGVDDVVRSLEANVIIPLENDQLATELGIKPKRGVLLLGAPGLLKGGFALRQHTPPDVGAGSATSQIARSKDMFHIRPARSLD